MANAKKPIRKRVVKNHTLELIYGGNKIANAIEKQRQ